MRAIVGLGNPGAEYLMTRHNAGFMVLDRIAHQHGLSWEKAKKWKALTTTWHHRSERVLLIKPQTFMNLSGQSVQAAMAFHKLAPSEVMVIVDDIHLPLATLRSRAKGSAGGHNGLRDIEARIGKEYPRLRLGIGAGPHQVNHVLGRFHEDEQDSVTRMLTGAIDALDAWLSDGIEACMRHNGSTLPPPPPKPKAAPQPTPKPTPKPQPADETPAGPESSSPSDH